MRVAARRGAHQLDAGGHVLPDQRVVAGTVVPGRQPQGGRAGSWLAGEPGGDRALVAGQCDEFRHRRAEATALVGLADAGAGGQHRLAVGQFLSRWRLVRHQHADLLRVPGHQGQCVDRAAAAGEDVGGRGAEGGNQPVQIVGVLIGCGPGGTVGALAASRSARIVGHHRPVGEMTGQGDETRCSHRRADEQQDRLVSGVADPYVVVQHGARHVQGAGLRRGHGCPFRRSVPSPLLTCRSRPAHRAGRVPGPRCGQGLCEGQEPR